MEFKLFVIFDKISQSFEVGGVAPNHQMFIRENVPYLVRLRPLSDLDLFEVGTFNTENGTFDLTVGDYKKIEWSDYSFPETRAQALAPLNIESCSEKRTSFNEVLAREFREKNPRVED